MGLSIGCTTSLGLGLFVSLLFLSSEGAQLTAKEFQSIQKLLIKQIGKKYPSDEKDQFSDFVTQTVKSNLTYYHRGDEDQPVFICPGQKGVGKKVVVMERGADYLVPQDKTTFVVLRKKGRTNDYNVHTATLFLYADSHRILVWGDARIEQQENSMGFLKVVGSPYLPKTGSQDLRPRCQWLGNVLFCNAKETVPAPPRKFRPPKQLVKPSGRPDPSDPENKGQEEGQDKESVSETPDKEGDADGDMKEEAAADQPNGHRKTGGGPPFKADVVNNEDGADGGDQEASADGGEKQDGGDDKEVSGNGDDKQDGGDGGDKEVSGKDGDAEDKEVGSDAANKEGDGVDKDGGGDAGNTGADKDSGGGGDGDKVPEDGGEGKASDERYIHVKNLGEETAGRSVRRKVKGRRRNGRRQQSVVFNQRKGRSKFG